VSSWVVPYRTAAFHPEDVVRRPDGIAVTSRGRTALDLARFVSVTDLLSIIEQVLRDGKLDGRLRGGPAESHGEAVLGQALDSAGLIGLERQHRIDLPGYGPARFDLDWTVERVLDGHFGANLPATVRRILGLVATLRSQR